MDPREELEALRRLAELEARAGGEVYQPTSESIVGGDSSQPLGVNVLRSGLQSFGGLGDEAVAGFSAGVENLKDLFRGDTGSFSDHYSRRLQHERDALSQFERERPIISTGVELGTSMLLPFGAASRGGGALARALTGIGSGAVMGGATGFGKGEGGFAERKREAKEAGLTSALMSAAFPVVGAAGRRVGDFLGEQGTKMQRKAVGLSANDFRKAQKGLKAHQPNPLAEAFDESKKMGIFKGDKAPQSVLNRAKEQIDESMDGVYAILGEADTKLSRLVEVPPMSSVEKSIRTKYTGTDVDKAVRHLTREWASLEQELDGSLSAMNRVKQKLWDRSYDGQKPRDQINKFVDRKIAGLLKERIESEVEELVTNGRLPKGMSGQVKKLNNDAGTLLRMVDPLERAVGREEVDEATTQLVKTLRTTGGYGVPIIVGSSLNRPLLGAGAALLGAGATSPTGRYVIGGAMEGIGNRLPTTSDRLTSALMQATPQAASILTED